VIAPTCMVALVLTGSRGGAVALGVAIVVAVVAAGRWRLRTAVVVAAITAATVSIFLAYAPADVRDRFTVPTQGELAANEGRATIWQVGWRMVEDRPVTGVGVGNFRTAAPHHALETGASGRSEQVIDRPQVSHNAYLQVLSELGVVGLALYLGVIAFSIACAALAARTFERSGDLPMEVMARSLIVAMAGILAADFFVSAQFSKLLWIVLALGPGLLAVARSQQTTGPREHVAG
jgi:O-antigen ligase